MKRVVWSCGMLATIALLLFPPRAALAQGVTSAAVAGRVTEETGAPVPSAVLTLVNGSTGQRYSRRSADDGRYNFENVAVGGPYTLQTRALGFEATQSEPFHLTLGQRFEINVSLKRAAVGLEAVTVTGEANPLVSRSRTGTQSIVSDSIIHRLPTLSRNFTDFIVTVPQVVSAGVPGTTLGGQNNRFNNIQIDGGVNNDLFGLAASGVPGGQANVHPISVEAVREYQVLIAPYDVRQGSFTGGLINAVTKSGTNEFHGSTFGFLQNQSLVGKDTANNKAADFTQSQYGATFSGPIVRDEFISLRRSTCNIARRHLPPSRRRRSRSGRTRRAARTQLGSESVRRRRIESLTSSAPCTGSMPVRGESFRLATPTRTYSASSRHSSARTVSWRPRTTSSMPIRTT